MNEHYKKEKQFWDIKGSANYQSLSDYDQNRISNWIEWQGYGKILDIGGGSGMISRLLGDRPNTECICVDISHNMLSHSKTTAVQADAVSLPFKDNCFKLVVAAAFFHHLPGQEKSLFSEINRVLTSDGFVVGYDPNLLCIQNKIFMADTIFRLPIFSPDEKPINPNLMLKYALDAGFKTFSYRLFSFKNKKMTPFEIIQRYFFSPAARGPLSPLLERWFFWKAKKR